MRLAVATIASAVGLKGHVRLKIATDDPAARFVPGALLLTDDGELTVADVRSDGKSWQVAFEGHEDRTAAEALRDVRLYIETDNEDAYEDEFFYHELLGLPVVDTAGRELGSVKRIQAMPGHDLIIVETARGEVMVPFVSELVPEVTQSGVVVDPPRGLFDDDAEEVRP